MGSVFVTVGWALMAFYGAFMRTRRPWSVYIFSFVSIDRPEHDFYLLSRPTVRSGGPRDWHNRHTKPVHIWMMAILTLLGMWRMSQLQGHPVIHIHHNSKKKIRARSSWSISPSERGNRLEAARATRVQFTSWQQRHLPYGYNDPSVA